MVVPKLRFQEFDGDWPSIPLKNFVSFRKGKGISKADIQEDGVFECIRYGELYTTYGQVITTIKSRTNISPSESILSQSGDVIIPASGETQIDIATASCVAKENVILGGDLNILSHNESGEWLAYYLSSAKKLEIAQLAQGNSVVHLYSSQLKELKVNRPSKEEQTKIATFLSAVDEKISQLSQKLHLLGQYKQGMMQKLFSQQLRFKADDGNEFREWSNKTIGDVANIKRGASPRPINDSKWFDDSSSIGWVRISDVSKSKKYLLQTEQYLSTLGIQKSRLVPKGNLIMSICATIGKPIYTGFDVCIHDGFVVFSELQAIHEYAYYYLEYIEKNWYQYGQAGTQVNLNSDIVSNEAFPFPCLEEQTKIANFLSAIDQKIDVVSEQLEQAKLWKKGLLQQMFV